MTGADSAFQPYEIAERKGDEDFESLRDLLKDDFDRISDGVVGAMIFPPVGFTELHWRYPIMQLD